MGDEEFLEELIGDALIDDASKSGDLLDSQEQNENKRRAAASLFYSNAANLGMEGLAGATLTFKKISREVRNGNRSQAKIEEQNQSLRLVFHELWRFRRFTEKKYPSSDS
jgi:hypothetical protein